MTDLNVSILRRLVQPFLASQEDLQGTVLSVITAADGDGQANEEDNVLTEAEARQFISSLSQQLNSTLSILTRNRSQLAGTLNHALQTARSATTNPAEQHALEGLLRSAASQDRDAENLSSSELNNLIRQMQNQASHLSEQGFLQDAQRVLHAVEELGRNMPEAFVPLDPSDQRASVDLNFLKEAPQALIQGNSEIAEAIRGILEMAGINPQDRRGQWQLTYERLQEIYNRAPAAQREQMPPPEVLMANLRFTAHALDEELNAQVGQVQQVAAQIPAEGVDIRPLIERRGQFAQDPNVAFLIEAAGPDGRITLEEATQLIADVQQQNPNFQQDPQVFLASAQQMVRDLVGGRPAGQDLNRDQYNSLQTLEHLERMRVGFTARDAQEIEENAWPNFLHFVSWVVTFGGLTTSWLDDPRSRESDILPVMGPTYLHMAREGVEAHDYVRRQALSALARVLGLPCPQAIRHEDGSMEFNPLPEFQPNPDPDFLHWLQGRPEGQRGVSIPNALEFMRTHDPHFLSDGRSLEFYEILTGDLYQAPRLWEIQTMTDRVQQEEAWYQLAVDLDGSRDSNPFGQLFGYFSPVGRGTTQNFSTRNLEFSRTILRGLYAQTQDQDFRDRVHQTLQDFQGYNITDRNGHVIEEGGGELGFWPVDWFRNYSTENIDGAVSDLIMLAASWEIGGEIFKGVKGVFGLASAAGRFRFAQGLIRFLGVRATATVVEGGAASGVGTRLVAWLGRAAARTPVAMAGEGVVGGAVAEGAEVAAPTIAENYASRVAQSQARIAQAQARVETARNGQAMLSATNSRWAVLESQAALAERQLARAQRWHRWLTSSAYERWIQRASRAQGAWRRAVRWHPAVPQALRAASAEGRTGVTAQLARRSSWFIRNMGLRGTGRALGFLTYDAVCLLGISGYVFENLPRHGNNVESFDREFRPPLTDAPRTRRRPQPHRRQTAQSPSTPPPATRTAQVDPGQDLGGGE